MKMRVLLVSPCKDPDSRKPKYLMIPQLALHLIAALTPPDYEVKIVEEEIQDINLEEECDLVGLSCMTSNAPRAYYLAQQFKKRGKTVVMGGIHPSILSDEALRYADSVVIGEAEGVWRQLLEDFRNGRLQKKYHKPYPSLEKYLHIKNLKEVKKRLFNVIPVMTTRGCPFNCDFCSVHALFGPKVRHIPVDNVVRYMIDSGGKFFLFLDDNIIGDSPYAKDLFTKITPLGIKWVGQASISIVKNPELLRMAASSGCNALFFGIETISTPQMMKLRKSFKSIESIKEAIKKVESFGIYFHASMIFGFDDDTKDIFPETLDFLEKNRISSASLNVLTPYPGTKIYTQYKREGRLIIDNWKHYDHKTVVFIPKNMTPFELQAGRLWVFKEFTKLSSIIRRFPFHLDHPLYHLAMNIGHRRAFKSEYNEFPMLASHLFPSDESIRAYKDYFSLSTLRFADFIPKNYVKTSTN
jgi:radical SAM superfamily enzyme YgiQ (UPF0313 family)